MLPIEISTAEAVELFSVSRKTIADWSAKLVMVKTSHGKFDLKKSLHNFVSYRDYLRRGATLEDWRDDEEDRQYRLENPPIDYDMSKIELVDLPPMRMFVFEENPDGSRGRLIGEEVDDGAGGKKTIPIEDAAP
jgi:hypothetical protein